MIWLLSSATLGWVVRSLNYPPKSADPEEIRMATALAKINYSRRMVSRVETGDDVWVYWRCRGMDDVSRVCDLSVGGYSSPRQVRGPWAREPNLIFSFGKDSSGLKPSCNI